MKIRATKPSGNKYFIRQVSGGYNGAVQGYPTDKNANVLSNCVGYANGRFNEIIGKGKCVYQLVCNAENFIERAKALGLTISKTPVVGGIMVWQKGATLSGYDGAGHVAIVEKVIDSNTIYTSESAYAGTAFFNATRTNSNGRWGMAAGYSFRGCIVNPAVKQTTTKKSATTKKKTTTNLPSYTVGKTYTVQADALNVRKGAGTGYAIKTKSQLTKDAQKYCNANGALKKGTKVTCQATKVVSNNVWIKIPSGWVCAYWLANKEYYVK